MNELYVIPNILKFHQHYTVHATGLWWLQLRIIVVIEQAFLLLIYPIRTYPLYRTDAFQMSLSV